MVTFAKTFDKLNVIIKTKQRTRNQEVECERMRYMCENDSKLVDVIVDVSDSETAQ